MLIKLYAPQGHERDGELVEGIPDRAQRYWRTSDLEMISSELESEGDNPTANEYWIRTRRRSEEGAVIFELQADE